jgi:hypothetical protein
LLARTSLPSLGPLRFVIKAKAFKAALANRTKIKDWPESRTQNFQEHEVENRSLHGQQELEGWWGEVDRYVIDTKLKIGGGFQRLSNSISYSMRYWSS